MHIGYFKSFEGGEDTLLLEADANQLQELRALFETLASGRMKKLMVHRLPFARLHHLAELRAVRGDLDCGVQRGTDQAALLWQRSPEGWRDTADKLGVLGGIPGSGHQYLHADGNGLAVQVSKGEYGEAWWSLHG